MSTVSLSLGQPLSLSSSPSRSPSHSLLRSGVRSSQEVVFLLACSPPFGAGLTLRSFSSPSGGMADAPEMDEGPKRRRTDDEGGGGGGGPAPPRDGEAAAAGAADAAQPEMTDRERCERMREELAVVLATRDAVRVKTIAENHRMKAELAYRAARGAESLKQYENTRKVIDNMKRYIIDRERQVATLKKLVAEKQEYARRRGAPNRVLRGPRAIVRDRVEDR